jgi:hypothetical protein
MNINGFRRECESMVRIFKKSDVSRVLLIPLLFAAFFVSRPIWLLLNGAEARFSQVLGPIVSVVVIALAVYAAVIVLRIRDRTRSSVTTSPRGRRTDPDRHDGQS